MKTPRKTPPSADRELLAFWQDQMREAAATPWLAGFHLRRAQALRRRFTAALAGLHALPLRTRRALSRRFSLGLAGAALFLALAGTSARPPAAHAGDILVGGGCTLADAITTANTGSDTGACSGGSAGRDTIQITTDQTLTAELPVISSEIDLQGGGYTIHGLAGYSVLKVISGGDLTVTKATISGGGTAADAFFYGGGIKVTSGALTLSQATVSGNSAAKGGGIYAFGSTVAINGSTIDNNDATANGGGFYGKQVDFTLHQSTVSSNGAAGMGGGLALLESTAQVGYSTINGNESLYGGGGIYFLGGEIAVENSTISGNTADPSLAPALAAENGPANGAKAGGGGIEFREASAAETYATIYNSTFTANSAQDEGGGFSASAMAAGDVTLKRSIVSGNSAANGPEIADNASPRVLADAYNIIGYGGSARSYNFTPGGSDSVPAGALNTILDTAGGLQDNGGPTFTYDLVEDSPAVDSVPAGESSPYDQRGATRDYNMSGGAVSISSPGANTYGDAGAVEYGSPVPTAVTLQSYSAVTPEPSALAALAGGGLLGASLALWRRARRRQ